MKTTTKPRPVLDWEQENRSELYLIAAISSKLSTEPMNEIDCEKWNWEGWSTKYSMSRLSLHIFHLSTSTFTFQLCLLTELGLVDCTSLHYLVFLSNTKMVNFLKLDFRTSANGQYSKWKPEKIIHKGEEMVEKCQTRAFGHSTSVYNRLSELLQS